MLLFSLAGILAVLLALIGWRAWRLSRRSPEELERRRRAKLAAHGKMGDAMLLEIQDHLLHYSYGVRGVEYTACQDIRSIQTLLPAESFRMIGPAAVKYDPRNPANSIVLAEQWSGLRRAALQ